MTQGLSPSALMLAYVDWSSHLAVSPGKQSELYQKALRKIIRFLLWAIRNGLDPDAPACIEPLPQDRRFTGADWKQWPFNAFYQSFLLGQQWWHNATSGVRGVSKHHEALVSFMARQWLDIFSPSNYPALNPQVIQTTVKQCGANFWRGLINFSEDWERDVAGRKPVGADAFCPGKTVAVTPGKIVYRNRLIELIQYAPARATVYREPVLIVPAWIMKYYILDLSPKNSLVRFLTDRGHTVYMISWKNPSRQDRDLSLEDYRKLGVHAALDAIGSIQGEVPIHGVGYCLGGTLLAISAAALERGHDKRFKTVTLLAAQTDFSEAGELTLFIDDAQIAFLEDLMWSEGYLSTRQLAGAFQMLRSNDLIWSRIVGDYLLGLRRPMSDLMAWNADATRLPYRMHTEYLSRLFLRNDLAEGRYIADGYPVVLADIRAPIFAVGTEWDHISPWRSVYKINYFTKHGTTFLLSSGGHNVGIVSEPGRPEAHYRQSTIDSSASISSPDKWFATTAVQKGSWWPCWQKWLAAHSSQRKVKPPASSWDSAPSLGDAPGEYVLQQ
jgi:polyhydroxyalkanoate synthase subunit PhaC